MNRRSPWSRNIACQLARLGIQVVVIDFRTRRSALGYLDSDDSLHAEGIAELERAVLAIHFLNSRFVGPARYVFTARQFRRVLDNCRADVLLTLYGGGYGLLARLSGFRPFITYLVGSDVHSLRATSLKVAQLSLSRAAKVLANGTHLAHLAARMLHRDVIPLYIGVDSNRFRPAPRESGPLRIVCTRGFDAVYNNEYLIRGVARIRNLAHQIEVTFVSAGPLLAEAQRLASELFDNQNSCRFVFLGGANDDNVLRTLQSSDIYVSVSRSDGTSVSLLEALACGLFPILSDIAANREWVDPVVGNGILVPLDNPPALAAALELAICDPGLRERARDYNRRMVLERADSSKTTCRLKRHLQAVHEPAYSLSSRSSSKIKA